ncbi:MAG: tetratricopeptide repeat protein, partial [Candidatus Competibacter sp.]|nr:tetratricopeptide repeat protein [Candidatus Competibacter sp.]
MVALSWHQTGTVYQEMGQPEAAEDAYRQSLAIKVRLGNVAGQASTLNQLGIMYDDDLGRPEEAVAFLNQAADKYLEIRDAAKEGRVRNNLAIRLRKLRRLNEARQEIRRAIECGAQCGKPGPSSPTSRGTPATPPPLRRREPKPSVEILRLRLRTAPILKQNFQFRQLKLGDAQAHGLLGGSQCDAGFMAQADAELIT